MQIIPLKSLKLNADGMQCAAVLLIAVGELC